MKRAVSISIGSSKRNKSTQIDLLGVPVQIERIGTDGDMEKAAELFRDLDGKVDAFGVGGTDLGFCIDGKFRPLNSVQSIVRYVKKTPVVDGNGLKVWLESTAADVLAKRFNGAINPDKVLITSAVDRWGLAESFTKAGYDCVYGDLMFALGLPIPIRSFQTLKRIVSILVPIVSNFPFEWLYPTGDTQEKRTPKWENFFEWADVIAGDCHYINRYMPESMEGKIIVTNTTTEKDREMFKTAGVHALMTTTPILDGRSFGTNMMEAALVAATDWNKPIIYTKDSEYMDSLKKIIESINIEPQLQILNP